MTETAVTGIRDGILLNNKNHKVDYDGNQRKLIKTSPEGRKTFSFYDSKAKLIKDSTADIVATTYKYDSRGRRSEANQDGRKTTFEYDSLGRQSRVTDPYGRVTQFFYDGADRLIRTVAPDSSEVLFSYDRNGNMLSLTPPGKPEHTFDYSPVDLETIYTPPFAGDSARTSTRQYNFDKEVTRITRPDSININLRYGGPNSLSGQPKQIEYDQGQITLSYDTAKGILIGIASPSGDSLVYQYDAHILKKVRWAGVVHGIVAFDYDNDMHIAAEMINGLHTVKYIYDRDGLMRVAGDFKLRSSDINNLLLSDTLNGITTDYGYNALGELASEQTTWGATVLSQFIYTRDSIGRITAKTENIQSHINKYTYDYDSEGRIVRVGRNDTITSTFVYDENGNRTSLTTPADTTKSSYDAQDRLLNADGVMYVYNTGGDLRLKIEGSDTTTYEYDAIGNLIAVHLPDGTAIGYIIDGRGHRIGRRINGRVVQRWLYSDNLRIVAELDSLGLTISRFVYATKVNVPDYFTRQGIVYRVITDHLGSVRLVVNSFTGEIAQRIEYDEFGNVMYDSNPGFQPFGFAGGLLDRETKFIRFGARDYDAFTGRWTTSDKARFKSGQTNFFAYALNDPVNSQDPTGLSTAVTEARVYLGSIATLYAFGELIDAINEKSVGKIALRLLAASVAATDAQDAANDWAMEVKNLPATSNIVGLAIRRLGFSKDAAMYIKSAIYIANLKNVSLIQGSLLRRVVDGGLLGIDALEFGKNLGKEVARIIEVFMGPYVMKPE